MTFMSRVVHPLFIPVPASDSAVCSLAGPAHEIDLDQRYLDILQTLCSKIHLFQVLKLLQTENIFEDFHVLAPIAMYVPRFYCEACFAGRLLAQVLVCGVVGGQYCTNDLRHHALPSDPIESRLFVKCLSFHV